MVESEAVDVRDAEIESLRARLRAAEQRVRTLEALIDCVPGVLWETWVQPDPENGRVGFVSEQVTKLSGYSPDAWLATPEFWLDVMHPEDRPRVMADQTLLERGMSVSRYRWVCKDGKHLWVDAHTVLVRDEAGNPIGFRGVTMDATATVAAEEERAAALLRETQLRTQEAMLLDLSTPLIPLDDSVMVMPLVGALERTRAERATSALLDGVAKIGARAVILDITGVPNVDGDVAASLVQAAQSVALLGAEVVLTGIKPEVARTLVALGVDLGKIVTKSSLQAGIAHVTKKYGRRV